MAVVSVDERELMSPGEVARRFRVTPKTVGRWAASGRLTETRTAGGHRRFFAAEVEALAAELQQKKNEKEQ